MSPGISASGRNPHDQDRGAQALELSLATKLGWTEVMIAVEQNVSGLRQIRRIHG
jgi:hypothetical protein